MTVNDVDPPLQMIDAAEYWARNFGAFPPVPDPVDVIATPAPWANVTWPTPIC